MPSFYKASQQAMDIRKFPDSKYALYAKKKFEKSNGLSEKK